MSVNSIPLAVQEERARRAGVPLAEWQAHTNNLVKEMRVQANRSAQTVRVIKFSELSDSQRRALRRMSLGFAETL